MPLSIHSEQQREVKYSSLGMLQDQHHKDTGATGPGKVQDIGFETASPHAWGGGLCMCENMQ
jgi:hypothetical protein